jgi:NAD(P)-dependent dehydrogenase (short-subunit alcohol dehydrogenase family)
MKEVVVVTGASSGFGALTARALARAGHTVYATMRETEGRNAPQVAALARYSAEQGVDLRAVELAVMRPARAGATFRPTAAACSRRQ